MGVAGELCLVRHLNHPGTVLGVTRCAGCKHQKPDYLTLLLFGKKPHTHWCLGDFGTDILIMLSSGVTSVLSLLCTAVVLWIERDV